MEAENFRRQTNFAAIARRDNQPNQSRCSYFALPRAHRAVNEENYLRVERAYGSFSRSFSLANSVKSEEIKTDYQNGALTLNIPKREETKPKQIKVNVGTPAIAAAARAA